MTELKDLRPKNVRGVLVEDFVRGLSARVVRADSNTQILGVTLDSADVAAGDLFVAIPGFKRHGAEFAKQAVSAGAVAVVSDRVGVEIASKIPGIALIEVEDPRSFAGLAAAKVYGNPGAHLNVVGVTGTNGKTTTTHFIHHVLTEMSGPTLLIGTVGVKFGDTHASSVRTSVEAPVLHRILAWALEAGAKNVVMEVSSHAMSLHRVAGLTFDVAAFLNLQRDHLDFHKTMESYFEAKSLLFKPETAKKAVICTDDDWGKKLAARVQIPSQTVSTTAQADWQVESHSLNEEDAGTDVTVDFEGLKVQMHCTLPGMINVQNQLTALAILTQLGFAPEQVSAELGRTPGVPGRMEVVSKRSDVNPLVIVDFAHTPDALASACAALDPVTPGNLWLLFGATGDRDRGKRPVMGEVASSSADVVILTDDDIYSEDPAQIRAEVAAGFTRSRAKALLESDDRANAIRQAVVGASARDTVLIAGRGHETVQMIGDTAHELDDRVEARAALLLRTGANGLAKLPGGAASQVRTVLKTWEDLR
ncbi:MAG: UDP-N-acetylmuramoyl-L-alanyl-D-glutamate--2,6-diaminopimelate ligase [Actinomycetaceae bacterium]|nr:UDP-N-acetylmuramoyl-L-alanyl-D-glutamate--2,6-diaminopimelate ligase [Actinomycetaceae bacterium]